MIRHVLIFVMAAIVGAAVWAALAAMTPASEPDMFWIFFRDKGFRSDLAHNDALVRAQGSLLPRAAQRRAKVFQDGRLVDDHDLPVYNGYIESIRRMGIRPRVVSKWLNAVSAPLSDAQYSQVLSCSFVGKIVPLARSHHEPEPKESELPAAVDDSALYGLSWTQAALVNLPPVHEMGYNGSGVVVGVLDAGFNNLPHHCFDSLNVLATWDFVNGDSNVANHGDIGDGAHGTKTLSVLAGYDPGHLVGPAWRADFVLAKTENTEEEAPYEEDLWVAGLEWADSLGAEVISSSLSYMDWYTYEDMNGNTAVTTIAADAAASRGIAIFNSNGNIGSSEYDKMHAPADGDSVMGIGAVNPDSSRSYYSSYGPTYDGRIKPDLMAMGSGAVVASPYAPNGYQTASGTSFSCPMAAGIGALLLQVDPGLAPGALYQALRETASQASNPDTVYGWGIINTLAAVNWVLAGVPDRPDGQIPIAFHLSPPYPNPFNSSVRIEFTTGTPMPLTLEVYNVLGRKVATLFQGQIPTGIHRITWTPEQTSSGRYWIRARTPVGNRVMAVVYLR
jgi:serine protease AprX